MTVKTYLPIEQRVKDETDYLRKSWSSGPYSFLLLRTKEKYNHKINRERRKQVEIELNLSLPMLTDEMLQWLYEFACLRYSKKSYSKQGQSSGFGKTDYETLFYKTLNSVIKANPKLKHLEVYPSQEYSKDLRPNFKMVVGNYVPDFLVFGLKIKGCSAVAIEINGGSHVEKSEKDKLRNQHLKELKIFTFDIENEQANDFPFILKALNAMYRLRNGSFNSQIMRAKRLIWVKTISCHLTLSEIENIVLKKYSVNLNLLDEISLLEKHPLCPRAIKFEAKR